MSPRTLVLVGAGHAHAQVLLSLAERRWLQPDQRVVVVSPTALAPYSGMVPGWLMGRFTHREICIDFESLCQRAGAQLKLAELDSLDPDRRTIALSTGEILDYDLLSLNVGSTLRPPPAHRQQTILSLRPLSALREGWESLLRRVESSGHLPSELVAVGAGAAGFESILAVSHRLRALVPAGPMRAVLVGSRGVLPGHGILARRCAQRALDSAGIEVRTGQRFGPADAADDAVILWATGAQAHDWQLDPHRRGNLAVDAEGFVRVDRGLQSVSHPEILAVGDCASLADPRPKAGVYAVRQGPVLTQALQQRMSGMASSTTYHDHPRALALLLSSPHEAIVSYGPLGLAAHWALDWKDRIDRRFVRRFNPAISSSTLA